MRTRKDTEQKLICIRLYFKAMLAMRLPATSLVRTYLEISTALEVQNFQDAV